ncbi:hypothetical protein SDRG_02478 [Saprolegnia diclina VS20]|uniref:Uncharacterized protein n=1 Tax=Saprolegnia diclina (strain VS20) TaxID=1156394 RepID=T0R2Q2_SAPDV|nr:hypothetical protein SDRG_02478 [Saprolegnia diclina VS20]EQC40590.1 hypothetical protein SDRG_02478 [Saprolegnia diclina VS20]|eukprot:XP_008606289.1 hypothetical protein SDRG_02478 [Saprolegnia diclina VS20]
MSAAETGDAVQQVLQLTFGLGADELRGQIQDLIRVFDKRTEEDDLKEILQITHPKARHLNGWHLERLAMEEYEEHTPQDIQRKIHGIKKDMRTSRSLVDAILNREKDWATKRDGLVTAKMEQREAMQVELDVAKRIVQKLHAADEMNCPTESLAAKLAEPAPVEERLLASHATEATASGNVDLSEAPSI